MWLVHYYNYLNTHITQFDLTKLIKLIPKSITSKSLIYFEQIHLLIEQLLYRFVYYHHCTCQIYLSLSVTFINLLRDGFQMPPEEIEDDNKNNQEQKSDGGPSGMGDGKIEKDAKDVSDQIETEDQLEETKIQGQEQDKQNENNDEQDQQQHVDEEENGIEVSFDFEAPMEDPSQDNDQQDDNNEDNDKESETNDEENIDDQMGDVNEDDQGEIFDENKWGDEDKDEQEQEDQEEKKPNETDQATGKDKKQRDGLSAKDEQLELNEESIEENPEMNNNIEDQPPDTTNNDMNSDEQPYELPENMDLDGNDEKEQINDEDNQDIQQDENKDLTNEEENIDKDQQSDIEDNQDNDDDDDSTNKTKNPIPDNLPDEQEDQQLEQSALTQDKTSTNLDSKNQPNDLENNFANAQTFEEDKSENKKENLGESSTLNTSQTQQISSNQQNQLTQQLNNNNEELQQDNIQNSTNQSNEQRTLSEIASFIEQNIKAAFDIEQTDENINMDQDNNNDNDEQPSLEQNQQQTQIYAHAKNIPKDFPQQKQILDSATDEQIKNLNEQDNQQTEPMIIDNQQQQHEDEEEEKQEIKQDKPNSSSKLQKEPINKSKTSSTLNSEQTNETNENISIDKPFISTTTVEHKFDYLTKVQSNLTEQVEYQLEEWYTNINENINDLNDAEQLWTQLEYLTQPYVYELCEQLRLLLEPTQKTKYSGDYRTGKRLNMKRIISYIASDFRKDRIWLRRSKPSKRQYQLILAIDDSQSMDNLQVKRLALESLILLGQTLNLLDIGQFGIVSFGQYIRMLQPLSQNFNHENGIQILKQLKFDQTKTLLAEVKTKKLLLLYLLKISSFLFLHYLVNGISNTYI